MDPLSDVLSLLKPRSYLVGGFDVGGDWSLRFGKHDGIKCYAVVSGECWLVVEGIAEAARLEMGDCFLLPHGRPFRLTNDVTLEPIDAVPMIRAARGKAGGIAIIGDGGCCLVGGHFSFSGGPAAILLELLPPMVHLQKESDKAAMRWALERMREELIDPRPGASLVAQHLAYLMLVQALRLHLGEGMQAGIGWLFALADAQIGGAITAMHESPGRRWTLQELGEHAGMSRSIFALRFKEKVGTSPMEYLTRWRMLLAQDRLANSREALSGIAHSLGYESESAFSTAFKRIVGCSPRHYHRSRATSDARDEDTRADFLTRKAG